MEYKDGKFTYCGELIARNYSRTTSPFIRVGNEHNLTCQWARHYGERSYLIGNYGYECQEKCMEKLYIEVDGRTECTISDELTAEVLDLYGLLQHKYNEIVNHVYDNYSNTANCGLDRASTYPDENNIYNLDGVTYKVSDKFIQDASSDQFARIRGSLYIEVGEILQYSSPKMKSAYRKK